MNIEDDIMKLRTGFITHEINGTQMMVAAGPAASRFHGLVRSNETAAFIIDCLKRDTDRDQILEKVLQTYDVSEDKARADIDKVLQALETIGALEQ